MAREADVVRSLVEMADTLVDDFDVVDLLTGLADRCVRLQAKGVIAERAGTGLAEAFSRLRAYARNHDRRLTDVAQAAIDGTLDPQAWAPPASQHPDRRPDGPACGGG